MRFHETTFGVDPRADRSDEVTEQSLRRIASILGVGPEVFFGPAASACAGRPRSRIEQAAALLRAFDRIDDPQMREAVVAFAEAEADAAGRR